MTKEQENQMNDYLLELQKDGVVRSSYELIVFKKAMKKAQLLSVVFSLIMFTGVTAGTAVSYAESDENNHDFDDRLEHFCGMTVSEKEQLFDDHPRLAEFEDRLTGYCELDEDEREDLIDKYDLIFTQYEFDALMSFSYNLGQAYFTRSGSMGTAFKSGDKAGIARAILLYNRAGGRKIDGLVRRRKSERHFPTLLQAPYRIVIELD